MWHIGQDVVCIKDHSRGKVKEGKVYTIKSLRSVCCDVEIDVGIVATREKSQCKCGFISNNYGTCWLSEHLFKPLDELSDISELLEVLNKENYQEV